MNYVKNTSRYYTLGSVYTLLLRHRSRCKLLADTSSVVCPTLQSTWIG